MTKRLCLLGLCLLLCVPAVFAQDVPDEIDDFDGDYEDVLEQLAEDGYINADGGELLFEDNRLNFDDEDDDDTYINFVDDEIENVVLAATVEIDPDSDAEDLELCILGARDGDGGFIGVGINNIFLYLIVDQNDDVDDPTFETGLHSEDFDDEAHFIIVLLEDEITVYVDGQLVYEEDDFSEREGIVGFARTTGTDCQVEDVWVWEIDEDAIGEDSDDDDDEDQEEADDDKGNDDEDEDDEDDDSDTASFPDELDNFDGGRGDIIEELEDSGAIPSGSTLLFNEDRAFISRTGYFVTVLGRTLQRQDVIVSATVTFDSESDELELCSVGARQNFESDDSTTISQYIDVGFDNTGQAFVLANGDDGDGEVTIELDYEVDIDEPVAVLFILDDDTITVYMDGELVLERGEVFAEAGFFAVTVFAEDGGTSCEVS
ncbi:MAG: hypothetical protein AAFR67_05180, partial [Chloroflexota bacterium]